MYVDAAADLAMAESLILNAKCQRPGVCNAIETVLVHSAVLEKFAATTGRALLKNGVQLRCDDRSLASLRNIEQAAVAAADGTQASSLCGQQASCLPSPVATDATGQAGSPPAAQAGKPVFQVIPATPEDYRTEFLDLILAIKVVDSLDAAIAHIEANGSHHSDCIITADETAASHFLAEVDSATVYWNASTRHARGPMGLEELTTYKYLLRGNGQVRG